MTEKNLGGRPVGPDGRGRVVSIYIPHRVMALVDEAAHAKGVSRSGLITTAIKAYVRAGWVAEPASGNVAEEEPNK